MYFRIPLATSGDRAAIPNTDPGTGVLNYTNGYGGNYSLNPTTDPSALRINRQTFNELMYNITATLQALYQWGAPPFIESADNGGSPYAYAKGAVCVRGGIVYQSNTGSNTSAPPGANWTVVDAQIFNAKAPTASPAFTGSPTAPTPSSSDTSTLIATMAAVAGKLGLYGIGTATAPAVTNLNSITNGGLYRFTSTASNRPGTVGGVVLHLPSDTSNDWYQIALNFDFVGSVAVRWKDGGSVGSWILLRSSLNSDVVTDSGSNANGNYRIWSSGRKEIWRTVSAPAGTSTWSLATPLDSISGALISFAPLGTSTLAAVPAFNLSTTGIAITTGSAISITYKVEGV